MQFEHYIFIIAFLALIQSIFGVGILLIGTPLMIFLGVDYNVGLSLLIPCSLMIGLLQIYKFKDVQLDGRERSHFFKFILPAQILGLAIRPYFHYKPVIYFMMILAILFALLYRLQPSFQKLTKTFLKKNFITALIMTGLIHGLCNMGGALIGPINYIAYEDNPKKSVTSISFDYFFMALTTYIYLGGPDYPALGHMTIGGILTSVLIFTTIGPLLTRRITNTRFVQLTRILFICILGITVNNLIRSLQT